VAGGIGRLRLRQLDAPGTPKAELTATPIGTTATPPQFLSLRSLSLGVIPTIFTDTDCEGAVFRASNEAGARHDSVVVRYRQDGQVVMGWLAMLLGALPSWTHGSATTHHRTRERTRLAVLAERQGLLGLVGR
jgi:hypothetical protein